MNWDAIGAVGEIVGALAVFGSLVFVGMQFRQASNQTLQMLYQQTVNNFTSSPENARIVELGNREPDSLTPHELFLYAGLILNMLNAVALIWEQKQRGLISTDSYLRVMDIAAFYFIQPGFKAVVEDSVHGAESDITSFHKAGYPEKMFTEIEKIARDSYGWKKESGT